MVEQPVVRGERVAPFNGNCSAESPDQRGCRGGHNEGQGDQAALDEHGGEVYARYGCGCGCWCAGEVGAGSMPLSRRGERGYMLLDAHPTRRIGTGKTDGM